MYDFIHPTAYMLSVITLGVKTAELVSIDEATYNKLFNKYRENHFVFQPYYQFIEPKLKDGIVVGAEGGFKAEVFFNTANMTITVLYKLFGDYTKLQAPTYKWFMNALYGKRQPLP